MVLLMIVWITCGLVERGLIDPLGFKCNDHTL